MVVTPLVEQPAARAEVDARRGVVVFARTDGDADSEAVARGEGKAGKLLGQDRRRVQRGQQDIASPATGRWLRRRPVPTR